MGLRYLVRPVRELASINQKGHLYVLIGPQTFSAAMANAAHFRTQTAALLVGQPIVLFSRGLLPRRLLAVAAHSPSDLS